MARPPSPSPEYLASIGKEADGSPASQRKTAAKRSPWAMVSTLVGIMLLVVWDVMLARGLWAISRTSLCPDVSANVDNVLYDTLCVVATSDAWANTMGVWKLIADFVDITPGSPASGKAQPGEVGALALITAPLLAQLGVGASMLVAPATVTWQLLPQSSPLLSAFLALPVFLMSLFLALPVGAFFTYKILISPFLTSYQNQSALSPGGFTLAVFGALCAVANLIVSAVHMPDWGQTLVWLSTFLGAAWTYVNV